MAACWQVSPDVTRHVSEPLASMLDRYLPERAKRSLEVGLDPVTVMFGLWSICSQCQANETALVAQFQAAQRAPAPPPPPEAAPTVDPGQVREEAISFDQIGAEPVTAEV